MSKAITSAQAREWAQSVGDPVAALIEVLAQLRHYERSACLEYGEAAHRLAMSSGQSLHQTADADWARANTDPVSELGEFVWVLNQFERCALIAYGTPPHANALEYAQARWQVLQQMAGLTNLESGF